ncbi:hypothetical protein FMUND_4246 [Fusarium mundagurra]|uniref:Uncharacterized protein n=1 Tax=Fusarium mundagurra TaxID=1567541 RepID=A0A8H5YY70_9HYPO|nr:hypothetical protein FMUND_4246 [Fusarium mundagurra]
MSKEEKPSSSSQTTPPGSSEASGGHVSQPPYESAMLSREPMPEPVHVIVEPLEMSLDTMPEEAKPWWARKRERIGIFIFVLLDLITIILLILFMCQKTSTSECQNAH